MKTWAVFKQDTLKKPHQMVGSVHATDAEIALLEARTVYARRPKAVSMWVAPMESVKMWTREEVAALRGSEVVVLQSDDRLTWQIFRKTGQRRAMTFVDHIGSVEANSAESALQSAITQFGEQDTWVWAVVPDSEIGRSDPDDVESWFMPALSKTYKQQSAYGFIGGKGLGAGKKGKSTASS